MKRETGFSSRSERSRYPRAAHFSVWRTGLVVGALWALLTPVGVQAHGELEGTIPEPGSKLEKAPDHLVVNFTEPPTRQSVVTVSDGCRTDVVDEIDFQERTAHVYLRSAEPGRWKVSYEVISSSDGHKTDGSYALTVAGKANCRKAKADGNARGPGPQAGGDPGGPETDGESSFPLVPVALGTAGLVGLALLVRRLSG